MEEKEQTKYTIKIVNLLKIQLITLILSIQSNLSRMHLNLITVPAVVKKKRLELLYK